MSGAASTAIQQAVFDKLRTNAALAAVLAESTLAGSPTEPAIYDHVDQASVPEDDARFPYVVLGEDTAAEFDTDDTDGQETTVTLHVWDRRRGRKRLKQVLDAVYDALHDATLTITGQVAVLCLWEYSETVPDPDVLVQHAVTRFRILTQSST